MVLGCIRVYAGDDPDGGKIPNLTIGFTERFRFVTWDNAITLDASQNQNRSFTRHRTSFLIRWAPLASMEIGLKLTNEFRVHFVPDTLDFDIHEIILDNLYLQVNRPWNVPVNMTLGRQNIMLGEGFVVMDGHPLDGSRSIYFNAARLDILVNASSKLILFYTYQPVMDDFLPVINPADQRLIEQPEEGIGVYYSAKYQDLDLDVYYIRKNILSVDENTLTSGIHTLGGRILFPIHPKISVTGEGSFQSGSLGNVDRSAFGGIFHIDYQVGGSLPCLNSVTFGMIHQSGDNPKTEKWEGWDPLFSRWPKWSESYIYTLIPEYGGKVAYWSNLSSLYVSLKFNITEWMDYTITYHRLTAPIASEKKEALIGGGGHGRGDLLISMLKFKITRWLNGHLLWDRFMPGNYYRDGADPFNWFRCELMVQL